MTVNEAENKLRSRSCATGVDGWMWNYDVEDGTITLSLTAGKKHASRSVPSDKIFLDEHGRAMPSSTSRRSSRNPTFPTRTTSARS